jgi:hypothetical protein
LQQSSGSLGIATKRSDGNRQLRQAHAGDFDTKLRHGRRYRGRGQGSQHISAVMERLGRSENLV